MSYVQRLNPPPNKLDRRRIDLISHRITQACLKYANDELVRYHPVVGDWFGQGFNGRRAELCAIPASQCLAVRALYPTEDWAAERIRKPSPEAPFLGLSPLAFMLADPENGLALTRRYFDWKVQV